MFSHKGCNTVLSLITCNLGHEIFVPRWYSVPCSVAYWNSAINPPDNDTTREKNVSGEKNIIWIPRAFPKCLGDLSGSRFRPLWRLQRHWIRKRPVLSKRYIPVRNTINETTNRSHVPGQDFSQTFEPLSGILVDYRNEDIAGKIAYFTVVPPSRFYPTIFELRDRGVIGVVYGAGWRMYY